MLMTEHFRALMGMKLSWVDHQFTVNVLLHVQTVEKTAFTVHSLDSVSDSGSVDGFGEFKDVFCSQLQQKASGICYSSDSCI